MKLPSHIKMQLEFIAESVEAPAIHQIGWWETASAGRYLRAYYGKKRVSMNLPIKRFRLTLGVGVIRIQVLREIRQPRASLQQLRAIRGKS